MKQKKTENHALETKSRTRSGDAPVALRRVPAATRAPRRIPNPEGPFPPLPDPIPEPMPPRLDPRIDPNVFEREPELGERLTPIRFRALRHGCYLARFTPTSGRTHYDGTIRVERHGSALFGDGVTASGDLYRHSRLPIIATPIARTSSAVARAAVKPVSASATIASNASISRFIFAEPNPANGIPIFARGNYRYYLRITQILENYTTSGSFGLGFERWRYNGLTVAGTPQWVNEGPFTARMEWKPAPSGYPSAGNYLEGDVKDSSGTFVGRLTMGWVSAYLRKATIEIDTVSASETPLNSGAGHDWRSIFDEISWDLTVDNSNHDVTEPSGESWSDSEMHAAMLARRDSSNLDREWRYHVLCVRRLDSTSRGIMYDNSGTDSNDVPREGAGISSHWTVPNADPWGRVKGMRFGTATGPYFRTALHEIGHAMGLYHNTVDMGIMNTTNVIAEEASAPQQFPDNVKWAHASDDQKRLKHMPDVWVRPGGIPFGANYSSSPLSPDDEAEEIPGLELRVEPLLDTVPIGAPVRVNVTLINTGEQAIPVPKDLSLRGHSVRGKVLDASGTVRTFRPVIVCVDEEEDVLLAPGERVSASMTLLRGAQGALFPSAGTHRISVELDWELEGILVGVTGEADVMVTPARDDAHASAALRVLTTPNALLSMVIGGDHLEDGNEAIQACLDNDVLRPHYAVIEAKRLAKRHGKRRADLAAASDLLDDDAVMSEDEISSIARLGAMTDTGGDAGAKKKLGGVLQERADAMDARPDVRVVVAKLSARAAEGRS